MNMNRIIKFLVCLLMFLCVFSINTNKVIAATTTVNIECSSYTKEGQCNYFPKCRWVSGKCYEQNVASEPCNDNNIKKVLRIFGFVLLIAKYIIPFLIIAFGTFDLYKSVTDKDEKSLYKQLKVLGIRIIAGIIVFFIPNMLYAAFSLSDKLNIINSDEYKTCASCVFKPLDDTTCSVDE